MSTRASRLFLASGFVASMVACDSKKETSTPPPAVPAPTNNTQAPNSAVTEKPADKPVDGGFVIYTTALKKEGSDKPKIEDAKGKLVGNWLGTLYRGERVSLVKDDGGDYVQMKTSGEVEGFVKRTSVLLAADISEATVLESTDAFDRPDLLALNGKKKVNAGTLIFVLKSREQFSEVNAQGTGTVWVLNGRLTTDKDELAVAKILAKARSLKEGKDEKKQEGIADLVSLAKNNFGNAKLVALMETEMAEAPMQAAVAPSGDAQ